MLLLPLLTSLSITLTPPQPTPVAPNPVMSEGVMMTIRDICRTDIAMYANGNKTWLEDKAKQLPENQRIIVLTACGFYAMGMSDGMILVMDKERN
jgi:hypothetical protein